MVTRTFKSTTIAFKVAKVEENVIVEETTSVPKVFTDTEAARRYLTHKNTDTNRHILSVTDLTVKEQLYACTDEDFLTVAKPVESRHALHTQLSAQKEVNETDSYQEVN